MICPFLNLFFCTNFLQFPAFISILFHLNFCLLFTFHLILSSFIFHLIHKALAGRFQSSYRYLQIKVRRHVFSNKETNISEKKNVNQILFKLLMSVLFISFLYLNLHFVLVKFFSLTTEGVESNPGIEYLGQLVLINH